jgi:hypothetical protein
MKRSPSPKPKIVTDADSKKSSSNTAHFFMGNKILDELKILIRLAGPDPDAPTPAARRKRRAKQRPLRDAA